MSVQMCEGVWRTRCGQRLYITEREPSHGQRWTDGLRIYSDDGLWALDGHETTEDLVEYIGPLPQQDQTAEIERLKAELKIVERGRDLANADADHLRAEFTAAQQLRAENESLTVRLQRAEVTAAEALQKWETTEQVCLKIITALAGVRS